ncbi:hypothetical protein FB446DRAFT_785578 [Lentinula raphanica]|nr:hypothetical protein FB446DRAFT_785578 [Lentinula raphanica]
MTAILPASPLTPATSLLSQIWNLKLPETSLSCPAIIHLNSSDYSQLLKYYKYIWESQSPQAAWNWLMERMVQDATLRCSWAVGKEEISVEGCFSKIGAVKKLCDELSPFGHGSTPSTTAKPLQGTSIPSSASSTHPPVSLISPQSTLRAASSPSPPCSSPSVHSSVHPTVSPPPGLPKYSELNKEYFPPSRPPQHVPSAVPSSISNFPPCIPPSPCIAQTHDLGFSVTPNSDSASKMGPERAPTYPDRCKDHSAMKPHLCHTPHHLGIRSGVLRQVRRNVHGPFGTLLLKSRRRHIGDHISDSASSVLESSSCSPVDPHGHRCSPHLCGHSWHWRITSSDSGSLQNFGHLHSKGLSNKTLLELASVIHTILIGG